MKPSFLTKIALIPFLCGIIIWTIGGNHWGITQNQMQVTIMDPFLGPQPSLVEKFTPGLDFPLAGMILSGSFLILSFLIYRYRRTS